MTRFVNIDPFHYRRLRLDDGNAHDHMKHSGKLFCISDAFRKFEIQYNRQFVVEDPFFLSQVLHNDLMWYLSRCIAVLTLLLLLLLFLLL